MPTPHDPPHHPLHPLPPNRKPHQIRHHQKEHIRYHRHPAEVAIELRSVGVFLGGKEGGADDLRQDEEGDEPAPHEEAEVDVVPQRDEGEDDEGVDEGTEFGQPFISASASASASAFFYASLQASASGAATTHGNVDVADDPAVEGAVPAAPEGDDGVIVAHAADDVFGRVDAVEEGPEAEEAEGDEQLQPDDVQVEVAEHAELEGRVAVPVGGGGADGDGVDVVEEAFHAEEEEEEAEGVEAGAAEGDAGGGVPGLADVVIEG